MSNVQGIGYQRRCVLKKLVLRGVFDHALARPRCDVQARYYKTVDGAYYHYVTMSNIGPQGTITKSKFLYTLHEPADLPESNYAPANLKLSDIELGVIKYFNPITHISLEEVNLDFVKSYNLPVTPKTFSDMVFREFNSYFPGLNVYMSKALPFERVLHLMSHDLSGGLRKKTSAGIGFKLDRKQIAREHSDSVRSCYDLETFDFDILWKIFLKDELRETVKSTRSIAVGQLHLWVISMKYMGGIYEWFSDILPSWSGYGIDDMPASWELKFGDFDPDAKTYGFDLKQQDSKMSPGWVDFMLNFMKSKTPIKHWGAIEWYFEQTFYDKKIVDARGNVLLFSQGQPSGNPFTIIFNTLQNLYTHCVHNVILKIRKIYDPKKELFCVLGDDTLMQTQDPELYRSVCLTLGHATTSESGALFNDVSFLSMKLTTYRGIVAAYYSNMDKMFASLRFTTKGDDEYFMKLCSFYGMLIYAPTGTTEYDWKKRIEAHILYFLQMEYVSPSLMACYKPSHLQKRDRSGMVYHSSTLGAEGGLNLTKMTDPLNDKQKQPAPKGRRKRRKPRAKKDTVQLVTWQNPPKGDAPRPRAPSTKRLRKVEHKVLTANKDRLSASEMKIAKEYVSQILWPTRPIKLIRPIPVRSYAYFKHGEITFESSAKYNSVEFRPDPFRFIELKQDAAANTVSFATSYSVDWNEKNADEDTFLAGSVHYLCFDNELNTTSGTVIPNAHAFTGVNTDVAFWGPETSEEYVTGYYGMTCAGVLQVTATNRTPLTCTFSVDVRVYNKGTDNTWTLSNQIVGPTAMVLTGGSVSLNSSNLTSLTCTSNQLFVPVLRVTCSTGNIMLKDLVQTLYGSSASLIATGAPASKLYTFGDALYPNNADLAAKVMDAFNSCLLWSPVAMACLYNVQQELSKAGGKFAISYLPSNVQDHIPEEFASAWSTLATWATSYPHAETQFSEGAHATWIGARIDDYAFRKPSPENTVTDYAALSMPSDIFISNRTSTDAASKFQYYITFAACFEIQSLSPNWTMELGPSSTVLMPQLIAMTAASDDLVGENPSHVQRLKRLATQIVSNPVVQQGFKSLAGAGLTALMAL